MMLNKILKNKKANMWLTLMIPFLFVFIFGILTFIGYSLFSQFYLGYQESGMLTPTTTEVFEDFGQGIKMFDWIAVIIVIVLIIGSTWALSIIKHTTIEFVAAWIMCPFIGFIGFVFNYMFLKFISEDIMNTVYLMFPKITILATNAHWIAFGTFIIAYSVIYVKRGKDTQEPIGREPI